LKPSPPMTFLKTEEKGTNREANTRVNEGHVYSQSSTQLNKTTENGRGGRKVTLEEKGPKRNPV